MIYILFRLIKIALIGAFIYYLYKVLWKGESPTFFKTKKKPSSASQTPPKAIEEMKKDPVCGTYVPEKQAFRLIQGGETFYFCSEECKEKYRQISKK